MTTFLAVVGYALALISLMFCAYYAGLGYQLEAVAAGAIACLYVFTSTWNVARYGKGEA